MGALLHHFRMLATSVAFLSRLPVPSSWQTTDAEAFKKLPDYFAPAGFVIGLLNASLAVLLCLFLPIPVAIALCIGLQLILTGAFHEDGFADLADAMGGYTIEKRFEIMRDSRLGTFGVSALVILFLIRWSASIVIFENLDNTGLFVSLLLVNAWSRWTSSNFLRLLPYLHPTGKGIARGLQPPTMVSSISSAFLLTCIGLILDWRLAILILLATVFIIGISYLFFRRLFGGINGDCLGAITISHELLSLIFFCSIG